MGAHRNGADAISRRPPRMSGYWLQVRVCSWRTIAVQSQLKLCLLLRLWPQPPAVQLNTEIGTERPDA
jgi:hypothetical protein